MTTTTRRRALLALAAASAVPPATARAHHGWSEFGREAFVLEGTAREVRLGNPHGIVAVEDARGQVWEAQLAPPSRNRAAGLVEGAVAPGDAVRATGRRHRDPARLVMKTERLEARGRAFDVYPERLSSAAR